MLIASEGDIATQVAYCLRAMNSKISLLAGPNAAFIRYSTRLRGRHQLAAAIDGTQDSAIIDQIRELHRSTPFDVVLPSDQPTTELLARIAREIPVRTFPLPASSVIAQLRDKARFAKLCRELSLPIPKTVSLRSKAEIDIDRLVAELGLPLVIKPAKEAGGTGLVIAQTREMIRTRVIQDDGYAFEPLVAQEFVPGIDMGVSLVAHSGEILCITTQIPSYGRIEYTECPSLEAAASNLVSYLKYSGAANLDARFDPTTGRAVFVECNPRFWGTIAHALWCGTNFIEAGLCQQPTNGGRLRVEPGRFSMRPVRFCLNLVCFKLERAAFSRAQLMGLWLALTDPLPILLRAVHALSYGRSSGAACERTNLAPPAPHAGTSLLLGIALRRLKSPR